MSTKEPWEFPTALTFLNPLPYSVSERVQTVNKPTGDCRQSKRRGEEREHQKHSRTHRLPGDEQHQCEKHEDNTRSKAYSRHNANEEANERRQERQHCQQRRSQNFS